MEAQEMQFALDAAAKEKRRNAEFRREVFNGVEAARSLLDALVARLEHLPEVEARWQQHLRAVPAVAASPSAAQRSPSADAAPGKARREPAPAVVRRTKAAAAATARLHGRELNGQWTPRKPRAPSWRSARPEFHCHVRQSRPDPEPPGETRALEQTQEMRLPHSHILGM